MLPEIMTHSIVDVGTDEPNNSQPTSATSGSSDVKENNAIVIREKSEG